MKKTLGLSLLLMLGLMASSFGQVKDASKNLKQQAEKMGAFLMKGDYKAFSVYTHPIVLKMMGGAPKMIEILTRGLNSMKEQGISFKSISMGEPSKLVKSGKELQATIPQNIILKLPKGSLESNSTLVAISTDNGVNWTFIDTSNNDIATLKKVIPTLSPALVIPPRQAPIKHDN